GVALARAEGLDRLEVGARAEAHAAGAGEDQDAGLVVGDELAVALAQALGRRAVDGVAALLAVDGEDRRGADALVADLVDHQPPAQSRAGRCFLRRALRRSRAAWSSESRSTSSGKKMMTMNPAFVTTLSSASP